MRELRAINTDDLEPDQRLIHTHLWERCVGVGHRPGRGLRRRIHRRPHRPTRKRMFTRAGVDICDEISLDEVAITTGLSPTKASWRILTGRALAPDGPLAATGAALRAGRISWDVAAVFVEATLTLTDEQTRAVQDRVLPRAISVIHPETGAGCWRTRAWAVRELRRAILTIDPDAAAKRREEAHRRRGVTISFDHPNAMAWINAYLPAHEAMVVYDTLTAMATTLRE
jgi:hypothetical protein